MGPKILMLDIETAPNVAYVWGLFDQNVAHNQLEEAGYILCWAAKWHGDTEVLTASTQDPKQYKAMLLKLHKLLDDADIVVHYYGSKFDIPTVNKEFAKAGIAPPSPYKQIDLKLVVQRVFRFESNKLDYVAHALGLGKKIKTEFELWVGCMKGDKTCWRDMLAYNRMDVVLLERLYKRLLPWIEKHPNYSAYLDQMCCPRCGSPKIQKRGTMLARDVVYQRYQCQVCGSWFRDNKRLNAGGLRAVNA